MADLADAAPADLVGDIVHLKIIPLPLGKPLGQEGVGGELGALVTALITLALPPLGG